MICDTVSLSGDYWGPRTLIVSLLVQQALMLHGHLTRNNCYDSHCLVLGSISISGVMYYKLLFDIS